MVEVASQIRIAKTDTATVLRNVVCRTLTDLVLETETVHRVKSVLATYARSLTSQSAQHAYRMLNVSLTSVQPASAQQSRMVVRVPHQIYAPVAFVNQAPVENPTNRVVSVLQIASLTYV